LRALNLTSAGNPAEVGEATPSSRHQYEREISDRTNLSRGRVKKVALVMWEDCAPLSQLDQYVGGFHVADHGHARRSRHGGSLPDPTPRGLSIAGGARL